MASYPFQLIASVPGAPESASPGACYFCGSAPRQYGDERFPEHEPIVDLATVIEFEGGLYMCATCAIEVAHLLGMEESTKVAEIKKANRTLGRRNQILTDRLEQATRAIAELTAIKADVTEA